MTDVGSNATNVLDFVLEAFSCASEMDLYSAVQAAPRTMLSTVLERYRTWAAANTRRFPDLGPGELRPYFVAESGLADWAHGGLPSISRLDEPGQVWTYADSLKHRLLYCHSLATDDPMGLLLCLDASAYASPERARLLNFCNLLLHFAPLIRKGIICFRPATEYLPEDVAPAAKWTHLRDLLTDTLDKRELGFGWYDEVDAYAPADVRKNWQKLLQNEQGRSLLHEAAMVTASNRIGHAFAASVPYPNKVTTYVPFRYDVDVLLAYQQSLAEQAQGRLPVNAVPDYENWLLTRLIDLELPGLDNLRPEELIQIRAQSDEFEAWRRTLAEAIKFADGAVPARIMNRDTAVRSEVTARLSEGKAALQASLPKSALLKGARTGGVTLIGGLLGAGASVLIDPTLTTAAILATVASGTAAASVNAAAEAAKGSTSHAKQAALAHYVAVLR